MHRRLHLETQIRRSRPFEEARLQAEALFARGGAQRARAAALGAEADAARGGALAAAAAGEQQSRAEAAEGGGGEGGREGREEAGRVAGRRLAETEDAYTRCLGAADRRASPRLN